MSLSDILTSSAAERPDNVAIKLDDIEVPHGMLDNAAARVATLSRSKGVEVGDRVGVMVPNAPYFPVVFFDAQGAGAVVVPMNVLLKGREVGFYLEERPSRPLRMGGLASVVVSLLDVLGLAVLCYSFGGGLAQELAHRAPSAA